MDLKQLLQQTQIKPESSKPDSETTEDDPVSETTEEEPVSETIEEQLDESEETSQKPTEESLDPRFSHPWNKLEKGMKLNRLLVFITSETKERQLTDTQAQALKQLLFKACDMGLFNKINDVKYNTETGIIESIKQLEYNDTSHKYKLKTGGSKGRSVSKSRSNIDRLMKK